jgi:hypothetical protein
MLSVIVYGFLIIFELTGIVAAIYILMLLILRPRAVGRFAVIIPPLAEDVDVANLLCAARLRVGLLGDVCRSEVILLDCGMSEHRRAQCETLCHALDRTSLLRPEEFLAYLGPADATLVAKNEP